MKIPFFSKRNKDTDVDTSRRTFMQAASVSPLVAHSAANALLQEANSQAWMTGKSLPTKVRRVKVESSYDGENVSGDGDSSSYYVDRYILDKTHLSRYDKESFIRGLIHGKLQELSIHDILPSLIENKSMSIVTKLRLTAEHKVRLQVEISKITIQSRLDKWSKLFKQTSGVDITTAKEVVDFLNRVT